MKKILILIIALFGFIGSANALEIKSLGFKSADIEGLELTTRDNKEKSYYMYAHDIYAYGENDDYKFYIRSVQNPSDTSFEIKKDITDVIFELLSGKDTNEYSYISTKDYKWVKVRYTQEGYNIVEYYIAWKDIFITITVQSLNGALPKDKEYEFDTYVHGIKLSGEGKVEVSHVYLAGIDKFKEPEKKNYVLLVILCLALIGITYWYTRFYNRKK